MSKVITSLGDNYMKVESYMDNLIEVRYELNGQWHREDGPAIEMFYPNGSLWTCFWYKDGEYHRIDGPAIIHMYEGGEGKICREIWQV